MADEHPQRWSDEDVAAFEGAQGLTPLEPPLQPPTSQPGGTAPAPGSPPPPQSGSGTNWKPIVIVVGIVAVVVVAIVVANGHKTNKISTSGGGGGTHEVVYKVEGTADSVDITIATPGGGTSQQNDLNVPIVRKSDGGEGLKVTFSSGEFLYLSAQNQGDSGSVTCIIEEDGIEVAHNTSSGAFTIATCQSRS